MSYCSANCLCSNFSDWFLKIFRLIMDWKTFVNELFETKWRNPNPLRELCFSYFECELIDNSWKFSSLSKIPYSQVKVSGGTQTDMKSYSLSSSAASQLSQSVRERIMSGSDGVTKSPVRTQNTHKSVDRDSLPGSLSDSTYTDLQLMSNQNSWFRHGSPYTASLPTRSSAVCTYL